MWTWLEKKTSTLLLTNYGSYMTLMVSWELTQWFLGYHLESQCCRRSSWFTSKWLSSPESTGSVQEDFELSSHHAVPCWESKDDPSASASSSGVMIGDSLFGGVLILESASSGSVSGTCETEIHQGQRFTWIRVAKPNYILWIGNSCVTKHIN